MEIGRKLRFVVLSVVAVAAAGWRAEAQDHPAMTSDADRSLRAEVALHYDFLRANAPPGGCGCFNLNGGGATVAWNGRARRFGLAGDFSLSHAGAISSGGYSLTLGTYTAGLRYRMRTERAILQPFAQALGGFAHSSGSLVGRQNSVASNAGGAFAAIVGGGVDLRAGRRFSVRLVEADYVVTTFDNGSNNHQNNLRLNSGVVLHF